MGRLNLLTSNRERPPRNIPNTFAPRVRNEFLNINQVIMGLQFDFIQAENLPDEVRAQLPKPRFNDDKAPIKVKDKENNSAQESHSENSFGEED